MTASAVLRGTERLRSRENATSKCQLTRHLCLLSSSLLAFLPDGVWNRHGRSFLTRQFCRPQRCFSNGNKLGQTPITTRASDSGGAGRARARHVVVNELVELRFLVRIFTSAHVG